MTSDKISYHQQLVERLVKQLTSAQDVVNTFSLELTGVITIVLLLFHSVIRYVRKRKKAPKTVQFFTSTPIRIIHWTVFFYCFLSANAYMAEEENFQKGIQLAEKNANTETITKLITNIKPHLEEINDTYSQTHAISIIAFFLVLTVILDTITAVIMKIKHKKRLKLQELSQEERSVAHSGTLA